MNIFRMPCGNECKRIYRIWHELSYKIIWYECKKVFWHKHLLSFRTLTEMSFVTCLYYYDNKREVFQILFSTWQKTQEKLTYFYCKFQILLRNCNVPCLFYMIWHQFMLHMCKSRALGAMIFVSKENKRPHLCLNCQLLIIWSLFHEILWRHR